MTKFAGIDAEQMQLLHYAYFQAMASAQSLEVMLGNRIEIEDIGEPEPATEAEKLKLLALKRMTMGKRVHATKDLDDTMRSLFPRLIDVVPVRNRLAHRFILESHILLRSDPSAFPAILKQVADASDALNIAARQVCAANVDRLLEKLNLTPAQVSDYDDLTRRLL